MAPEPPCYQPDLLKRFELHCRYQREKGPVRTRAYFVLSSLTDPQFLFSWLTLEGQFPLPPAHLRIPVSKPVAACAGRGLATQQERALELGYSGPSSDMVLPCGLVPGLAQR